MMDWDMGTKTIWIVRIMMDKSKSIYDPKSINDQRIIVRHLEQRKKGTDDTVFSKTKRMEICV